jgi:hypothetical protein
MYHIATFHDLSEIFFFMEGADYADSDSTKESKGSPEKGK